MNFYEILAKVGGAFAPPPAFLVPTALRIQVPRKEFDTVGACSFSINVQESFWYIFFLLSVYKEIDFPQLWLLLPSTLKCMYFLYTALTEPLVSQTGVSFLKGLELIT